MSRTHRGSLVAPVAACVFVSGAASLGLEAVWSRLLKLVFGSTTLAITTILVAYMLGLGIGGLLGGRLAGRIRNGVRAYGFMEVGIGAYALLVPWLLAQYPALNRTVLATLGFWPAAFVRFGLVLVVLAPPTLLMGATLPVLVAALARSREVGSRVGLLYGANTLGAVAGVLGATFLGFATLGVRGTNTLGALLDVAIGLAAILFLAPRWSAAEDPAEDARAPAQETGRRWTPELLSYGLVGFTALVYEVSWTRALAMILGSSVYAFATMLAGFLAGIGLGSLFIRRRLDRLERPERVYVAGLFALGLASLLVVLAFRALPDAFLRSFAAVGISGASLVWLGLGASFLVMLAPTLILGALFPLLVRLVAGAGQRSGAAVGDVYFVNTIGSAVGAFCAGFVLIPSLGLRTTMALAIAVNFATAALLALHRGLRAGRVAPLPVLGGILGAVLVLVLQPAWRRDDFALGVYYRSSAQLDFGLEEIPLLGTPGDQLLFYEEGINCNVSVHRSAAGLEDGLISLRINGKTDASLSDMSTQVLSGHLPVLFGAEAREALVIGYASGITAGALALHGLDAVDVCEIEPAVIAASHWFDDYNHRPLERENVRLIVDDGRTVLSTSRERWDVIVSEPSNPWMTGCANLFTREFFQEARAALRPGGRLLQWIQLYGMDEAGLTSVLSALFESFDYAYGFLYDTGSADLLVLATDVPLEPDTLPVWEELPEEVRRDLSRVRVLSSADLWSLIALLPDDLRVLAAGAPETNTDDNMFVELRAPWYLYDDTPDTALLLRSHAKGVLPLAGAEGEWPAALLAELALSYMNQRLDDRLAAAAEAAILRTGDPVARAVVEAERALVEDRAEPGTLALLDGALRIDPDSWSARWSRGWLLNRLGRHEDALADLDAALALRPGHLLVRHQRLKSLASMERMKEAYDECSALLESPLVETEPRLWAEGAFLAGGFGRLDEAVERMTRYLELQPYSPDEWELLAHWYGLSERPGARAEALENAALANRNVVRDYLWLARWHEHYGTREEALLAVESLLEQDPDNAEARAELRRLGGG